MSYAAFARTPMSLQEAAPTPEGYRILPIREGRASVLQIEPEAMIPFREGEKATFLAQLGILLIGPAMWLLTWPFGLEAQTRVATILSVWIVLGGYCALEMFLFAVRRCAQSHWRYGVFVDDSRVTGSPMDGEVTIAFRDLSFFSIYQQRWAMRPWLRYSITAHLHDGRQIQITPSIMRRKHAAEVAAVLEIWKKNPVGFVVAVKSGSINRRIGEAFNA